MLPGLVRVIEGGAGQVEPAGDIGAPETEAERIKRQLWSEGTAIVRHLAPGIGDTDLRMLIGWGAKKLSDGPRMVQVLRDVEDVFARAEMTGDPIQAIRGFVHTRAGTGTAAKARGAEPGPVTVAHRIRQLEAMKAAR